MTFGNVKWTGTEITVEQFADSGIRTESGFPGQRIAKIRSNKWTKAD